MSMPRATPVSVRIYLNVNVGGTVILLLLAVCVQLHSRQSLEPMFIGEGKDVLVLVLDRVRNPYR